MIAKWNSSEYGSQNGNSSCPDVWGLSAVQRKINANPAWYVPSKGEWSAFGNQLGITSSNYNNRGLSDDYWTSSLVNAYSAWYAASTHGCTLDGIVDHDYFVRLGATF